MKKIVLCGFVWSCAMLAVISKSPFSPYILDGALASDAMRTLCQVTETTCGASLDELVEATQKNWIRRPGQERWEMGDPYASYHGKIMPLVHKLGLDVALTPQAKTYDYALVLGATVPSMQERLDVLHDVMKQGVHVGSLVLLSGQRDLTSKEQELMQTKCISETDALVALARDYVRYPKFKDIPLVIVDAPKQITADGSVRRPTTGDTVHAWLARNPKKGTCLAISSQPFVAYQDTVLRTFLTDGFMLETIGTIDSRERSASLYLDTIARWLYQERLRQEALRASAGA